LPLIRKIINAGRTSRAVILPKSWLKFLEEQYGVPIDRVTIEVNKVLKIRAIINEKEETSKNED